MRNERTKQKVMRNLRAKATQKFQIKRKIPKSVQGGIATAK